MQKKIAITGASGFIGCQLAKMYASNGYEVIRIHRSAYSPGHETELDKFLGGCHAIINLAGATINKRWTEAYKRELYESRILTTRILIRAIQRMEQQPEVFISASAVGYYSPIGVHDEYSEESDMSYLAQICRDWEAEARRCPKTVRCVIVRLGVVFSTEGGALCEMIKKQRLTKVAAIVGDAEDPFPWISLKDVCRAIDFLLQRTHAEGIYNLVAPQIINRMELAQALYRHYPAWILLPIPRFVFKMLLGEGERAVTIGQAVKPLRLLEAGFDFCDSDLKTFFKNQFNGYKC